MTKARELAELADELTVDASGNATFAGDVSSANLSTTGNITVDGTVDGRDVAADGTKLDGIETGATADQTAAEIRALVEAAVDSNVFTDADHTKLDGIETGATADQTITAGSGLTGGGTGDVTISHADTSSQASVDNSGTTFIQDITLDAYGHVTALGSATVPAGGIGDGQTWQLPSRSAGVSYQNTTGKPIQVAITYHTVNNDNAPTYTFQVSTNNSTWTTISRQGERWTNHAHFAIVPNGHYYKQSGWNGTITWAELR